MPSNFGPKVLSSTINFHIVSFGINLLRQAINVIKSAAMTASDECNALPNGLAIELSMTVYAAVRDADETTTASVEISVQVDGRIVVQSHFVSSVAGSSICITTSIKKDFCPLFAIVSCRVSVCVSVSDSSTRSIVVTFCFAFCFDDVVIFLRLCRPGVYSTLSLISLLLLLLS